MEQKMLAKRGLRQNPPDKRKQERPQVTLIKTLKRWSRHGDSKERSKRENIMEKKEFLISLNGQKQTKKKTFHKGCHMSYIVFRNWPNQGFFPQGHFILHIVDEINFFLQNLDLFIILIIVLQNSYCLKTNRQSYYMIIMNWNKSIRKLTINIIENQQKIHENYQYIRNPFKPIGLHSLNNI